MDLAKTDPDGVYLGDNGRSYCGEHLGASARFTGRDISGQPIYRVTPEDARGPYGQYLRCEECGKRPALVWVAS